MANLTERGTIYSFGEIKQGTTKNGNVWMRQDVVFELEGPHNTFKKVILSASGDRVKDLEPLSVGDRVRVTYAVSAREWQGKWYNNVDLLIVEALDKPTNTNEPTAVSAEQSDFPFDE